MKRATIFFVALLMLVTGFSFASNFSAPYNSTIDDLVAASKARNAKIGVYAVELPNNRVLADINKDELLNPASCLKLITTAAALRILGPSYRFPTRFYLTSSSDPSAVPNLIVKGYGDPSLVIEHLESMIDAMVKSGFPRKIKNIIVDDNYFDKKGFPGLQKSSRSYNAMTSAVALNHSSITVEVSPNARPGLPAIIKIDAPGVRVQNMAKTAARKSRAHVSISRLTSRKENTIKVTGRVPVNGPTVKKYFSAAVPSEHFGMSLVTMLEERGVKVDGEVMNGVLPQSAKLAYEGFSEPLSDIIKNMNKFSNNFMAEQITMAIGAATGGEPGSTEKGVGAVAKYLNGLGIKDFYIENGSGLSYNNRVSVADLAVVMSDMWRDQKLRDIFIDSLSVAGVDGTTRRWKSDTLAAKLRAKTGSLNDVSSLAGFMPKNGKTVLFAIFINGSSVDFWTGRHVSQGIVETLSEGRQ